MLQSGKFYELRGEYCQCRLGQDKKMNQIFLLINSSGETVREAKTNEIIPGIRQVSRAQYSASLKEAITEKKKSKVSKVGDKKATREKIEEVD